MISVGIVGASGYTGEELIKLLLKHPDTNIDVLTSRTHAGKCVDDVYDFEKKLAKNFIEPSAEALSKCDVVFFASPNGVAMNMARELIDNNVRIIDISADFRIPNVDVWEKWYGQKHSCPELISESVYGLPEIKNQREKILKAKIIANPGCYPTASLLSLMPILDLIKNQRIIINATSGISGAGRNLNPEKLFEAGTDNYQAYAVGRHRHYPEMLNQINTVNSDIDLLFVPHLSSVERGIYSTHYVTIEDLNLDKLYKLYNEYYKDSQFVKIQNQIYPKLGQVNHTNNCLISLFASSENNASSNLVIMSAIDNLVKGASGQAIQNMNIMFNLPETTGLIN
jgi:N-acetyl-gamma-glutamyl-phosphate reductase